MKEARDIFVVVIAGLLTLLLALWTNDVRRDRSHSVTVRSATPIFAGSGNDGCDKQPQIATIQPGAVAHVRRIRYWKNCATVDISLPDGRRGYVVPGVGNFSMSPPLGGP